jgi:hypothetical protein
MGSIVLDPGIKNMLLEDARDFLNSKSWYAERGIPFRRGYLLVSLLGEMHIPLSVIFLFGSSWPSMGNQGLAKLARSIAWLVSLV